MTGPVVVRKVDTQTDFKAFFEFPWQIYRDDSHWVPPLLSMRRELLDKKKNPSWDYLEGDYFVAWRGAEPVGTITAHVNHRHNEFHEEHIAFFGFFETVNDQAVANALLGTAAEWAKSRGYDALRGPQSFTIMDECGLLVEGFTRPVLLMPYNPPYYQTLIENSGMGFKKVMDSHSMCHHWERFVQTDLGGRLTRLNDRIKERKHVSVRAINRKNLDADFELFREIYNSAWEKNWSFVPFTPKELDALVEGLGKLFDPKLACFAYVGDEPVGFLIAVPDFNQVLQKAYPRPGVPEFVTLLKALWHWKIRPRIGWVRVALMGVKEGYRNVGVDLVMYHFILQAILAGQKYRAIDIGWILESNTDMMLTGTKALDMEVYKTYRFYEKALRS